MRATPKPDSDGDASAEPLIYLDHAATSWPKPPQVRERLLEFIGGVAANAGRSGHAASFRSAGVVFEAREALAALLGVKDSRNLVFVRGTTEGVNLVLKGFLRPGDRVLASPMEHNAVTRPLRRLEAERGIVIERLPADGLGHIDLKAARARNQPTPPRLVVVSHGTNSNGIVQDVEGLRRTFPDSAILLDAAQTAGVIPIDIDTWGIDFLACSGHKGLLGPTGIGACYLAPQHEVLPLVEGGTGSHSEQDTQPLDRPDRYEGGTSNLHGIAGLLGGLDHLRIHGLAGSHKRRLILRMVEGLRDLPGVRIYSPTDGTALLASITIDGTTPDEVALSLEESHGVLCRPGLHCAPWAHRHLGTAPFGTVRLAPGIGNTESQIDRVITAIREIAVAAANASDP